MQSRVRDLRRSKGLTLADVAARCTPPTTAVTIGRLETGARILTLPWVNRIAAALQVNPAELLHNEDDPEIPVAATLTADGAEALTSPLMLAKPAAPAKPVGLTVESSVGDYRAGDQLWLETLQPEHFARAVNTDVLVPRPVGRFVFGRLIALEGNKLQVQPHRPGARQIIVADAPWLATTKTLIRRL
ncbi:helix-turn-helix domain-containing protein [Sandaracinobacteroides saxicola]|uniref:Helix-turn-helix transcriptional regulator n=1 Tax=Sandaracinobacteroides saxicola TaxID=2759707 RepID=A0A7G5IJ32_9SPHN|nr:helix-turn-helix transcriptional regulator [Sandaracinobacteroides saxicola]QMW23374.1 helix-turn-helix transcriptional regulator [Sandaracinobacteroides saxicola]